MEILRTALPSETENVTEDGVLRFDLYNNMMPIEGFAKFSLAKNLRVKWNRGRLIHLFQKGKGPWADAFRQMGLRPPYAVGCILRFLLRPKPEVWEQVRGIQREVRGEGMVTFGVHIRIPDEMVWEAGEGDPKPLNATEMAAIEEIAQPMLDCAQAIQDWWYPSSVQVRWLVVSNSAHLKASLKDKYPDKVVVSPILPRHSNKFVDAAAGLHFSEMPKYSNLTTFKDAYEHFAAESYRQLVADWLLLTMSHVFIIPESGFSRTAVLYSFSTMKVYVPNGTACDPEAPEHLTYMAGRWSGV
ncbi:hypothetical protein CLOM_g20378 [Closterium sp. NIES-68]|nr:hypothetical protein CLOM_g20378 [Closterium sp. NIES-68]